MNEFMINAVCALFICKAHSIPFMEPKQNKGLKFGCWFHGSNTLKIAECNVFVRLSSQSKMETLCKPGVWFCCPQLGHTNKNCPNDNFCEFKGNSKDMCNKLHYNILHDLFSGNVMLLMNNMISREGVLLMMSYVKSTNMAIPILWDSGSNISVITPRMAR